MKTEKTMPQSLRALRLRAIILAGIGLLIEGVVLVRPGVAATTVDVQRVAVSPQAVTGGYSVTGTITLTGRAPAGGMFVSVTSDNTAVAHPVLVGPVGQSLQQTAFYRELARAFPVSPVVTIFAGQSQGTFTITTSPVSTNTPVTITALLAGVPKTATLTVKSPALAYLTLTAATYSATKAPGTVVGGNPAIIWVGLTGHAPSGGFTLQTASNNPVAVVPASVTVPAGDVNYGFPIPTRGVAIDTLVTITGTGGGVTRTASLTVTPIVIP